MTNTSQTGTTPIHYLEPDELTQHEMEMLLDIARQIKRNQRGYMLVSPDFRDKGRALHIVGPLEKRRAA